MAEPKVEILSDSLSDGQIIRGWHRHDDGSRHDWSYRVGEPIPECLDAGSTE